MSEEASSTSLDIDEAEVIAADLASRVRGNDSTPTVDTSSNLDVELDTNGQSDATFIPMVDEKGTFNVVVQTLGEHYHVQVFDHADGTLTAYTVLPALDGLGSYEIVDQPVDRAAPSDTDQLSLEEGKQAKDVVIYVCQFRAYRVYMSVGWLVAPAEIHSCNSPATLQLKIWPEMWVSSISSWQAAGYLNDDTYGTYFYRNALITDCGSTNYIWRSYNVGTAIWPAGADTGYITTAWKYLPCYGW